MNTVNFAGRKWVTMFWKQNRKGIHNIAAIASAGVLLASCHPSPSKKLLSPQISKGTPHPRVSESPEILRRISCESINTLSWSPDGKTLATGSLLASLTLWNTTNWTHRDDLVADDEPTALCFSPVGNRLAAGMVNEYNVLLWDTASEAGHKKRWKLLRTLRQHQSQIDSITFSPDGKLLASGAWDADLAIWDVKTGRRRTLIKTEDGFLFGTPFSPDGHTIAATSGRGISLYRTTDWTLQRRLLYKDRIYRSLTYSPDGRWLVASGAENWPEVLVWDLQRKDSDFPRYVFRQGAEEAKHAFDNVAISPGGTLLAAVNNRKVYFWNIPNFEQPPIIYKGSTVNMGALAFSPDGAYLATGGGTRGKGELILWKVPCHWYLPVR
jgi:WD40 repeat protein